MPFLSRTELEMMGFTAVGNNVSVSKHASFYGSSRISLGNNIRIDDFCILSAGLGGIHIGNHVHIAAYTSLIGKGRISLGDFCNISSRVSIYSSSDDYSGLSMTNPTILSEFKNVNHADVTLRKHVIVGCGSVLLPGVYLDEGAAIGAMSLVTQDCSEFGIYCGIPATWIKPRSREILALENAFLNRSKTY